jgi:tRNA-intron endonuclease, archaea type
MQIIFRNRIVLANGAETDRIASQGYGTRQTSGKLALSLLEATYLHEKGVITLVDTKKKTLSLEQIERRAAKLEPKFWIRWHVFSDLRSRGYIVKTALKFGADFRVYERGVKPGEDHAKWVVYAVHEAENFSWHDFSAKNRVAHSTKKRLLLGIVDVMYYEVKWVRP